MELDFAKKQELKKQIENLGISPENRKAHITQCICKIVTQYDGMGFELDTEIKNLLIEALHSYKTTLEKNTDENVKQGYELIFLMQEVQDEIETCLISNRTTEYTGYLLKEDQEGSKGRENVIRLFETNDKGNIKLALSLIVGGGLHKDFVTHVKRIMQSCGNIPYYSFESDVLTEMLDSFTKWNGKGYKLEELPWYVLQMKKLKILDLSDNNLTELPKEISNLKDLKVLNLDKNSLENLPPEIGELQQLRKLYINENKLNKLPAEIGLLQQLKILDLDKNSLENLPAEIGKLQQLKKLYINENKLNKLPKDIKKLGQLKILSLGENSLTALPQRIEELRQLRFLFISNNKLTKLPEEVCNIPLLKILDVNYNDLEKLPAEIGKLKELRKLYIRNNKMKKLPRNITELRQLRLLVIDKNPLSLEDIGKLEKLEVLSLSGIDLKNLSKEFRDTKNVSLKELYIDNCGLEEVPENISSQKKLKNLNLKNNALYSLPEWIGELQHLKKLNLCGNNFTDEEKEKIKEKLLKCKIKF